MRPGQAIEVTFAIPRGVQFERGVIREIRCYPDTDRVRALVVKLDRDGRLAVVSPESIRTVVTEHRS